MQMCFCQQGGHGRRADGGKDLTLFHYHHAEVYDDVACHTVQSQRCTAVSMGIGFSSKQARCFSDGVTAGPPLSWGQWEVGKERVGKWSGHCQGL